jgi:uncharacterized membrane protein
MMTLLVIGLLLFFTVHLLPMVPASRAGLLAKWGEARYKGLYSLVSGAGLILIIAGYAAAERGAQWFAPLPEARAVAPYAMTLVFILLVASHGPSHIRAAVRHPMLIAVLIWSIVHLLANGDARGSVLFGSFAVYAVIDLLSVTLRRTFVPFVARWRSDVVAVVAGTVVALLVMFLHRFLFGVRAVPFGI